MMVHEVAWGGNNAQTGVGRGETGRGGAPYSCPKMVKGDDNTKKSWEDLGGRSQKISVLSGGGRGAEDCRCSEGGEVFSDSEVGGRNAPT